MGKHVPLPSDPVERAKEKRRRFAAYQKEYYKRQRRLRIQRSIEKAKAERERAAAQRARIAALIAEHQARQANRDLVGE